jgi:predicted small lipoprotein YifL
MVVKVLAMERLRYIYYYKNTERENKMNNKRIIKTTSAIALLLSLSLTACGTQDTQLLTATEESMQETATQETEANTETATDTESPLAQRDALEWEQRLDYSSERQAQLAEITVDLTQDTDEVQSKAQVLLEAMAGGDAETAVDSILTEDWYTVMLSDLLIGQRNYTGAADNGEWRMTILADELGQHCTAIEYPLADGRQFYVQVTDPEIRYYVCAAERTGSFVSESMNLTDGTYVGYEGTLSSNNRPEGAFTVHMGTADLSSGAADAFRNRSAQAVSYDGDFTAEGRPETATPEYLSKEGQMAYASRQEGKNIYYLTMTAEDGNDAFAPVRMGICNIWE